MITTLVLVLVRVRIRVRVVLYFDTWGLNLLQSVVYVYVYADLNVSESL